MENLMKRYAIISGVTALGLSACLLGCSSSSPAGKAAGKVAQGAEQTAGYVGGTVGSTATAVGKGVSNTTDRITGNVDSAAARKELDQKAEESLARLFRLDRKAKALFDKSYGYAVFDSRKSSFLVTVGGGGGVAVAKPNNNRTYMRMLTGGANLGAGMQFFQNVFLFETKQSFNQFVSSGWEAGTSANANFGRDSIDAQIRFVNGIALFQLADTGINLSADVTGTKYWKDKALN